MRELRRKFTELHDDPLPACIGGAFFELWSKVRTEFNYLNMPESKLASLAEAVPVDVVETQQVAAVMGGWSVHKEMVAAGMRDIKVRPSPSPRHAPPLPLAQHALGARHVSWNTTFCFCMLVSVPSQSCYRVRTRRKFPGMFRNAISRSHRDCPPPAEALA
jgi:hypothetical protein